MFIVVSRFTFVCIKRFVDLVLIGCSVLNSKLAVILCANCCFFFWIK